MFSKLNPFGIVEAHFGSLRDYQTDTLSKREVAFHIGFPLLVAVVLFFLIADVGEGVVGIIVSAASIVAGLMLNLLVLVYTLFYNARGSGTPITNLDDFRRISQEVLSTIAYSILLCLLLVITAFLILSRFSLLAELGRFCTIYIGTATVLSMLIVLKRCYAMVHFELQH